jgi:hypothetical protein
MSTVVMTHPKLDGEERAVTTSEAFEQVWSEKGWKLVQDSPAAPATTRIKAKIAAKAAAPKSKPAQAPVTDPKIGA